MNEEEKIDVFTIPSDVEIDINALLYADEMLKVLEEVQNYVEMFGESHLTDMVNEVIAKAKGTNHD